MYRCLPLLALVLLPGAAAPGDERAFLVSGFERIRVEGPFNVTVSTGLSGKVRATGERRALDLLDIASSGSTLTVRAGSDAWGERGLSPAGMPTIAVEVPRLTGASVNGGGRLRIAEMRGSRLDVNVSGSGTVAVAALQAESVNATLIGSGTITLAGTVSSAQLRSNGAGSIDAANLRAGDVSVVAETSGETLAHARHGARVAALGLGQVRVAGDAACAVTGSGPVACEGGIDRRR